MDDSTLAAADPAPEDVRKVAIAKLKRAASLPRMKDGRRPAMHSEGVSEGEKSGVSTPLPLNPDDLVTLEKQAPSLPKQSAETPSSHPERAISPPPVDGRPADTPKPNSHKRRSRSRSRSRGSKDLRKLKNLATPPPPSQSPRPEESSQDEEYISLPAFDRPLPGPTIVAPIHLFTQQQAMPGFHQPQFLPNFPPSLEMLQSRIMAGSALQRSNSAREQAMNKLLGVPEQPSTSQSFSLGPPSAFPGAKLARSNTATGAERSDRSVARSALFRKLSKRGANNGGATTTEGEQSGSGGEDLASMEFRRQPRRPPGTTVVDDRDPPGISPNIAPTVVLASPHHLAPLSPISDRRPSPSPSHASSQTPSVRRQSLERNRESALARLTGEDQFELEPPRPPPVTKPRLVVEENYDLDPPQTRRPTAHSRFDSNHRIQTPTPPRSSPKPDGGLLTQSPQPTTAANPVPILSAAVTLETRGFYTHSSKQPSVASLASAKPSVGDEEEVVYGDESRNRRPAAGNIISWVEQEEPRIPIDDETEPEDELQSPTSPLPETPTSPAPSNVNRSPTPSKEQSSLMYGPIMQSFPVASIESNIVSTQSTVTTGNEADDSSSSKSITQQPSVEAIPPPAPSPLDTSRTEFSSDWENVLVSNEAKPRSNREEVTSTGSSKIDSLKKVISGKLSRTPSLAGSIGRRSRSNSVANRRDAESALNRESASSFASGKHDYRSERHSHHAQLSASESLLSLGSPLPPTSRISHMPIASSNDSKYLDSKLHPLPGMVTLQKESERYKRTRGMSVSTPDVTTLPLSSERSPGMVLTPIERERKLSTQASDSRLQVKYRQESGGSTSTTPKTAPAVNGVDYFSAVRQRPAPTTPPTKPMKLPMDRQGVRHWLKKFVSTQPKANLPKQKISISDIKISQKQDDWPSETAYATFTVSQSPDEPDPYAQGGSTAFNKLSALTAEGYESISDSKSSQRSPVVSSSHPSMQASNSADLSLFSDTSPLSRPISITKHNIGEDEKTANTLFVPKQQGLRTPSPGNPDLMRSSKGSSPRSGWDSSDSSVLRSTHLMRRFNYIIASGNEEQGIIEPPRKLLATAPVLQIVDSDIVKRRILLLFNDLIILAKPLNSESMAKDSRPSALLDDPIIVKSVFRVRDVKVNVGRQGRNDPFTLREHPAIRTFVREFQSDPEAAIAKVMKRRDEPATLGCILFNAHDLDRAQLSSYLSRRTSKQVLRAYVDQFGFTGVRIDQALRVFWLSVGATSSQAIADSLLSGFATRWFDANSQLVSFDRDLAMRIVGAIMQLNQSLSSLSYDVDGYSRSQQVTAKEFVSAFRRYDPRYLVGDDLLERIYSAIEREKLAQPLRSSAATSLKITLKEHIPTRLTYRVESEPITVRIPSPDSNFSIQLLGHGLLFNPPVLHFASSAEASFRVTGTALGTKTIIFSRTGAHAPFYSGLPVSRTLGVEKAFMQNVFQLIASPVGGTPRTYMFSVDENHHYLQQQLESQVTRSIQDRDLAVSQNAKDPSSKAESAAEMLSLKVLRDTLFTPTEFSSTNGHYLHPASQHAARQFTTKSLARLCRQNSLLPSLLLKASQSRN